MTDVEFCPKCGTANVNNAQFCGSCGAVLTPMVPQSCPKCGFPRTDPNAQFCGECGAVFDKPVQYQPIKVEERPVQPVIISQPVQERSPPLQPNNSVVSSNPEPQTRNIEPGIQTAPKSSTKPRSHHDVFISYSSKDKPFGDAICNGLETHSIRCWIAPRDVPPGEDFPRAIINAINGSKIMVLIFSSHSNASPHVTRELSKALSNGVMIIPFRIENAPMSESMEYLIGLPHWLDAIAPPMDQHIDVLVQRVKTFLEGQE
jgi:ribosomal protein S27AE